MNNFEFCARSHQLSHVTIKLWLLKWLNLYMYVQCNTKVSRHKYHKWLFQNCPWYHNSNCSWSYIYCLGILIYQECMVFISNTMYPREAMVLCVYNTRLRNYSSVTSSISGNLSISSFENQNTTTRLPLKEIL